MKYRKIREALESCIIAEDRGMQWLHYDRKKVAEALLELDVIEKEAPTAPSSLSESDIEEQVERISRNCDIAFGAVQDAVRKTLIHVRRNFKSIPSATKGDDPSKSL